MNQLAIDFHARRTDPSTSHKAAATVGKFAGEHHHRIITALDFTRRIGSTIYEISKYSDLDHHAVARRLPELERAGLIYAQGERPGPSGRMCRVWYLKILKPNAELNGGEAVRSDVS